MTFATLDGPRALSWHEQAQPALGPGEVLVRIRAALTCGTDLKTFRRGHPKLSFGPFGHEAAGDIEAVGADVTAFSPGDPAMWVQTAPCGACLACLSQRQNLCERIFEDIALGAYGTHLRLAGKIVRQNLFRKPSHLSYIEAAFLEPLACVTHGWSVLRRADANQRVPRSVAIVGAGTIGLLHLLYAVQAGVPATVFARGAERLDLAMRLGADAIVDTTAHLPDAQTRFDAVIECAGTPEAWQQAIQLAKPGARVLFFGGLPSGTNVSLDANRIHYDELTCMGAFHFTPADVREARDMLGGGAANVRPLVSGIEPLHALSNVFERL
ncbi:MAG TPA: zinc-binding dehydrogenase, partial [Candidatus Eremiobacteraceae bacterium]|nr:zinc-binding dehydrogenase [Candidatus Eremiobacteraceae bacterium]